MGKVDGCSKNSFFLYPFRFDVFWVSVASLFGSLLGFFSSKFFRLRDQKKSSGTGESSVDEFVGTEVSVVSDYEEQVQVFKKFQFRTYDEEFIRSNAENGGSDTAPGINTSTCEFMSGEAFGVSMEEPETLSFTISEFYADSNNDKDFEEESKDFEEESPENFEEQEFSDFVSDDEEEVQVFKKFQFRTYDEEFIRSNVENGGSDSAPGINTSKCEFMSGEAFGVLMEEPETSNGEVLDQESFDFDDELSSEKQELSDFDLNSNAISSDGDNERTEMDLPESELEDVISSESEDVDFDFVFDDELSSEKQELSDFDSNSNAVLSDGDTESIEMDPPELGSEGISTSEDKDDDFDDDMSYEEGKDRDSKDSNGVQSLFEHQELIEQLKMELKKVRTTGLPTIPEESEYPRMSEDLKPWKIDEKMARQDTISEIHRFYDLYRNRMRKFDILNYQKMYAIGLLQSKDPLQSIPLIKPSIPVIGSLMHERFKLFKPKKPEPDPMGRFLRELHGDLEAVYVAQLCLSWEFLQWQYKKALELYDSDPRGVYTYDEAAGEFQKFQVLIHRFVENERFEGPRVQNYAKNRCVKRNLLQVPFIREDRHCGRITCDMIVEIMEESIRLFWRFLRADKDARNGVMRRESRPRARDPIDEDLLAELQEDHQKKERRVKIMVSGRSMTMVRRFLKRGQEVDDGLEQELYFFSQVDMKLVGKVLNLSQITTEQLHWCHRKLGKIRVEHDPSCVLFPWCKLA